MPDEAAEAQLWDLLRAGLRDEVVAVLLDLPVTRRRQLRPAVRRLHDVVAAHPTGARAPGGEWVGDLRARHWSAATAALLGCSTVEQAVRYAPLDPPDSRDLPVVLFPDQLDAFVREWSARFLRDPRAWDRIRGIESMFDWVHEGLVPPPVEDGAVLFLLTAMPRAGDGEDLLRVLEATPALIDVTFRRVFDVDGIKGASLAQRDEHQLPGRRVVDLVVPELVRRGHWTADFVEDGIARALARGQTPHLTRWFARLAAELPRMRAAAPDPS